MDFARRRLIRASLTGGSILAGMGMLHAPQAMGVLPGSSKKFITPLERAYKELGVRDVVESHAIGIKAPEFAGHHASVPVEVETKLKSVREIALLIESDPNPLAARFLLMPGTEGFIATRMRIPLGSSKVHVLVQAEGRHYHATRTIKAFFNCEFGDCEIDVWSFERPWKAEQTRMIAQLKDGRCDIKALISHPMHNGKYKDQNGQLIPANFIQDLQVSIKERLILQAEWTQAISRNPFFYVKANGVKPGDRVGMTWLDTMGVRGQHEIEVG